MAKSALDVWDGMNAGAAGYVSATIVYGMVATGCEHPTAERIRSTACEIIEAVRGMDGTTDIEGGLSERGRVEFYRQIWLWAAEMTSKHGAQR